MLLPTNKQLIPATAAVTAIKHIMYIIQPGLVRPFCPLRHTTTNSLTVPGFRDASLMCALSEEAINLSDSKRSTGVLLDII